MKREPLNLWLDARRKREMGRRLEEEIRRAKTNRSRLADEIGCTRQTLGYACADGTISVELLTEVVRRIGSSLDYIVLGRFPAADPEFIAQLEKLRTAAANLHIPKP